jgi:uncharacterized protein YcfJ
MLGYDSGSDSGKFPGSDSGKESGTILGKTPGNTLGYDSGSDFGKESGTSSGKNLGKHPGKNSGKEVGQDENVQDKDSSLLRVRDHFVHRNIKFIQDRFNKEIKLNPSQIKRVNLSRRRRPKGVWAKENSKIKDLV